MKSKFKVGDRVKIREWDDMEKEFGLDSSGDIAIGLLCFTRPMKHLCGRKATIVRMNGGRVYLDFDNRSDDVIWGYTTDMIQPLNETIVIYRDGSDVIALDKTTGQKAVARCNPSDKFDFHTGAKLALDRLVNLEKDNDDVIRVGDTVTVINTGKMYTTSSGWVAEHVKDAKLIAKYAYDKSYLSEGIFNLPDHFEVKVIADQRAYIQKKSPFSACYLVDIDGLKKVKA